MVFLIDALFILYNLTMITSFAMIACGCKPEKKQGQCPVREVTPSMRQAAPSDAMVDSTRTAMDNSEKRRKKSAEERGGGGGSKKSRKLKKSKSTDASIKSKKSKKGGGLKKIFKIRDTDATQPMSNDRSTPSQAAATAATPGEPTVTAPKQEIVAPKAVDSGKGSGKLPVEKGSKTTVKGAGSAKEVTGIPLAPGEIEKLGAQPPPAGPANQGAPPVPPATPPPAATTSPSPSPGTPTPDAGRDAVRSTALLIGPAGTQSVPAF